MVCCTYFMNPRPLTVRSRLQGSQPVENLLNACGVQRRSVRYRGLLDTAASGLPNAPSAFAEGSVNGCGSRPDVGLRTNDAGNIRTEVPCSGSAAVRSRVTAADSLGGPIWTGHSRSPPPLLRRRPPGWLGAPYGARASLPFGATLRGSPAGAGEGWLRPPSIPRTPALRRSSRAGGSPPVPLAGAS